MAREGGHAELHTIIEGVGGCHMKGKVKMMTTNETTVKMSAKDVEALTKENRQRGQTHGNRDANIGGFKGCISMKKRNNASHYVAVINNHEANRKGNTAPATLQVSKDAGAMPYSVKCMCHGTSRGLSTRRQAIQSARFSGARANVKVADGVLQQWCAGCVKNQQSKDE